MTNLPSPPIFPFTKDFVDRAPVECGIYALYDPGEAIYVGRAAGTNVTIRSRLQCHLRGDEGPCTEAATHFTFFATPFAVAGEVQWLSFFERLNGYRPRCNDRAA